MNVTKVTNIGDPQIVLYKDKYYQYATFNDGKTQGFYCWVSEDLENWSEPILCLDAKEHWGYTSFWAPEVVYHNGKFVMHYSARSRELDALRIGVAVSDSPTGPFVDVYGKPMFDFGYAAIDGSVLVCEEGNFLYYSRDCSKNIIDGVKTSQIYCVELDETLTKTIGEGKLVTTPYLPFETKSLQLDFAIPHVWNEGPCVIKMGDEYVMNYSANFYASTDYAICITTSKSVCGPWKKLGNNPVLSCNEALFGAGHNAFFYDKEGNLCTSFHIQTNPQKPSGDRTTVIGKVKFSYKNGELFQTIE